MIQTKGLNNEQSANARETVPHIHEVLVLGNISVNCVISLVFAFFMKRSSAMSPKITTRKSEYFFVW